MYNEVKDTFELYDDPAMGKGIRLKRDVKKSELPLVIAEGVDFDADGKRRVLAAACLGAKLLHSALCSGDARIVRPGRGC